MKLIETINNTTQTVAANRPLLLGSISRRVGCFTDYSNSATTMTLRDPGYYEIEFKVNATSTIAAQPVQITLFIDGTAQPETMATTVIATAATSATLNTHKKIRVFSCSDATISFVNTGTTETIYNNIVLDIKKVC